MQTDMFPGTDTKKSPFKKPDTLLGMALLVGLLGWGALTLLPILTTIVWNTINFGIAVVVGAILLYVLTNKKTWLLLNYLHEMTLKKLFGLIIELDPFVIAEDYIQEMKKEREKLNQQNVEVDAQKESLDAKIKEKINEKDKLSVRAKTAQKNNMMQEVGLAARQMERIDNYVKQLQPIRDSLNKISDYLQKVYKNSAYLIEDAENELTLKKDLYKSVTSGKKALSTALKIFKGDPDKKVLVEQSMEFLKDDIAGKLANMKNAIRQSAVFMESIDLDTATFEEKGLQLLEQFNPDTELKLSRPQEAEKVPAYVPGKIQVNQYKDLLQS